MLDWDIEPDAEDPVPEIAACIIEEGFESDYAECFYDDDKFREYLDEKFDDQYNTISNNGENPEKWDAFLPRIIVPMNSSIGISMNTVSTLKMGFMKIPSDVMTVITMINK